MFVLNAADGCIPSDMATGHAEQIEEERRLLYVAMTRAKTTLALVHPLRFFVRQQSRFGDRHVYAPRTRFIPDALLDTLRARRARRDAAGGDPPVAPGGTAHRRRGADARGLVLGRLGASSDIQFRIGLSWRFNIHSDELIAHVSARARVL